MKTVIEIANESALDFINAVAEFISIEAADEMNVEERDFRTRFSIELESDEEEVFLQLAQDFE